MKIKFKKKGLLLCSILFVFFSFGFTIHTQAETNAVTPPSFIPNDGGSSGNTDTTVVSPPSLDPKDDNYGGKLNGDTKTNLERWKDDLEVSNIFNGVFRGFGWWFIIQTGNIVNGINGATQNTYDILNVYGTDKNPGPLQKVVNEYQTIFIMIGTLVFLVMIIGILFSKNSDFGTILKNLLFGLIITLFLPFFFGQVSSITTGITKLVTSTSNTGYGVIDQNVKDLYAIDSNYQWNLPDKESIETQEKKQNFIETPTKSALQSIGINDELDASKLSDTGKNIAENALVTNEKGKTEVVSLNDATGNGWLKSLVTGDSAYYRYHVNFFTIIFYNLLMLIVSAFLLYKLINIEFEIVITAFILQASSPTDTKGKRNWEMISKIMSGFSAMIMVVFLSIIFNKGYAITSTLKGGVIVQVIAGIALAFAVIKGPNIFQSTFGVDAGLSGGLRDMMSFSQGMMMMRGGTGLAGNAVGSAIGSAGKTAKAGLGAAAGLSDKLSGGKDSIAEQMAKQSGALNKSLDAKDGLGKDGLEKDNGLTSENSTLNNQSDETQSQDNSQLNNQSDEIQNQDNSQMDSPDGSSVDNTPTEISSDGDFGQSGIDGEGSLETLSSNPLENSPTVDNSSTQGGGLEVGNKEIGKQANNLNGSSKALNNRSSNGLTAPEPHLGQVSAPSETRKFGSAFRNIPTSSKVQPSSSSLSQPKHQVPSTPSMSNPFIEDSRKNERRFSLNHINNQPTIKGGTNENHNSRT